MIPMLRSCSPLLLIAASAIGQTQVGGPIFTNTTWNAAGNPYVVQSSILVGNGATLTITPGVLLQFAPNTSVVVGSTGVGSGTLAARGSATQPIRFTGASQMPGAWSRIYFTDLAVDATFTSQGAFTGGSVLEHCDVEYGGGGTGVDAMVRVEQSSPWVSGCRFQHSLRSGITIAMGSAGQAPPLRFEGCLVAHNQNDGLTMNGGDGHVLADCTFRDNSGDNLEASGGSAARPVACTNCEFRAATTGARVNGNAALVDCRIDSNTGTGLVTSGSVTVTGSLIARNGSSGIQASGGLTLSGCRVVGNRASHGGGVTLSSFPTVVISTSEIVSNLATQDGGGIYFNVVSGTCTVQDSVVAGNNAGADGGGVYANAGTLTLASLPVDQLTVCRSAGGPVDHLDLVPAQRDLGWLWFAFCFRSDLPALIRIWFGGGIWFAHRSRLGRRRHDSRAAPDPRRARAAARRMP